MNIVPSPALRPSHPHVCRKRIFDQGHALSGRFASLDRHALVSGYGCLRVTDEEASGGGFVKGSSLCRDSKTATEKGVSRLSRFFPIPTRDGHDTCQARFCLHSTKFSPHMRCDRSAFRCPRRHAHQADCTLHRIQIGRLLHDAPVFATYHFPVSRMFTQCRRYTHLQQDFERVIRKHAACNAKRYPAKWKQLPSGEALLLPQLQEDTIYNRNRTDVDAESETDGRELQRPVDGIQHETGRAGRETDVDSGGTAYLEAIIHRCQRSVHELADLVGDLEKRRIERERQSRPRRRMR